MRDQEPRQTRPHSRRVLRLNAAACFFFAFEFLLVAGFGIQAAATAESRCDGPFRQGGVAVCTAAPGSRVRIGNAETRADSQGVFVIGFDRDAPAEETVWIETPAGLVSRFGLAVEPGAYSISRINGLPEEQVNPKSPAQLARIESSSQRKRVGDRSRAATRHFADRFLLPIDGRMTSEFGAQRILNGTPKRPHFGVDLAAPTGTPIRAPAAGRVTLADDDLYFEGAMIVIDHGQGFLSKYLHVSRIDVAVGQTLAEGDVIGAVGSRGRSTGPHLCWRLKWRDRNLDPSAWLRSAARPVRPEARKE